MLATLTAPRDADSNAIKIAWCTLTPRHHRICQGTLDVEARFKQLAKACATIKQEDYSLLA